MATPFGQDGFAEIESGLDHRLLDAVAEDVSGMFGDGPRDEGGPKCYPDRVMDAWRVSDAVRAVALAEPILAALSELVAPRPRAFQTLNFETGTEQHAHSDAYHFNSAPSGMMCGVWVALEDIDELSGPVVYYPGSHLWPEVTADTIGTCAEEAYHRYVDRRIEETGIEPRLATLSKGQALVWASNLVHGGSPRRDPKRTRRSQVTHYLFGDARCWVPKSSTHGRVRWREVAQVA